MLRPKLDLKRHLLILAFLLLAWGHGFAQKFSDKPDQFATDVTNFMRLSKVPSTIAVADNFSSAWGSLNAEQQQTVIRTIQQFTKNKLRAKPYYESYMLMVIEAVNQLASDQKNLNALLLSAEKVITNEKPGNIVGFCDVSRSFLTNSTLYFSKFYNLRVGGAKNFEFAYVDAAPAYDPIPTAGEPKKEEEKPVEAPKPKPVAPKPKPKPKPAVDDWGAPIQSSTPAVDDWGTPIPKKKKKPPPRRKTIGAPPRPLRKAIQATGVPGMPSL